ncbi:DUF3306 domain-containing protein [Granulosicoccus sp.]|nr:DUF3306 domain-containing protein [Granulosicoccus sp.]MDB4224285.1 DUF3306 domain-containing protein [Granulosicoccus sp.]
MSENEPETSFLNRWSSRKRDVAKPPSTTEEEIASAASPISMPLGAESSAAAVVDTPDSSDAAEPSDAVGEILLADEQVLDAEELILSDADMPPVESLTAESDVSAFFNKGVSAALRKAALRFVFQQPKFNVRDGLNDYDGDYTVFEPLGDTITSDMKFHAARKERDRLAAEAEREEELLRQEQLEADQASKDVESAETAETHEESVNEKSMNEESGIKEQSSVDDELSPETDEETRDEPLPETEIESVTTTLALADSDDESLQKGSMLIDPIEQV